MHVLLKQISKYFPCHLNLFHPVQGEDVSLNLSWMWRTQVEGLLMISNKLATNSQESRTLRGFIASEFLGPPWFLPGPSLGTKNCCLMEQGFLRFVMRQMCCHGNPSQTLNLPLQRNAKPLNHCLSLLYLPVQAWGAWCAFQGSREKWWGLGQLCRKIMTHSCIKCWVMCSRCWSQIWCGIVIQMNKQVLLFREVYSS